MRRPAWPARPRRGQPCRHPQPLPQPHPRVGSCQRAQPPSPPSPPQPHLLPQHFLHNPQGPPPAQVHPPSQTCRCLCRCTRAAAYQRLALLSRKRLSTRQRLCLLQRPWHGPGQPSTQPRELPCRHLQLRQELRRAAFRPPRPRPKSRRATREVAVGTDMRSAANTSHRATAIGIIITSQVAPED